MTVRIKFSKFGSMKFIGHLDVMRYFQKAIRRAGLDVCYSQGFHPHQIMSFAAPLGVGLTSDGEYVDVDLHTCESEQAVVNQLNEVMTDGFFVTECKILPETPVGVKKEAAMSLIVAADYQVSVKDEAVFPEGFPKTQDEFAAKMQEFLAQEEIVVVRKTKKNEKEENIRPFILAADSCYTGAAFENHAQMYENGRTYFFRLTTGSVNNLKPELVMDAFCAFLGIEAPAFAFQYHRIELYTEGKDGLVPLYQYTK